MLPKIASIEAIYLVKMYDVYIHHIFKVNIYYSWFVKKFRICIHKLSTNKYYFAKIKCMAGNFLLSKLLSEYSNI